MATYVEIKRAEVPEGVRFTIPGPMQGQIIEVAFGGFEKGEHNDGAPYKKITDRSIGPVPRCYRNTEAE